MRSGRRPVEKVGAPGSLLGGMEWLGARYVDGLRWWVRYAEGLRTIAGQPGDAGDLVRRGIDFARREGRQALREQTRLTVDHTVAAVAHGMDLAERLLQSTFGPAEPDGSAERGRPHLLLEGAPGQTASRSFAVSNRTEERRDVRFTMSEFVREGGGERFRAPISFTPSGFPLEPGAQRAVRCDLPLGAPFAPGIRYLALLRVVGFPGMDLVVVAAARDAEPGT